MIGLVKKRAFLLFAILISVMSSCGRDNDSSDFVDIAGVWANGTTTLTLGKNGSYRLELNDSFGQYRVGTYSYNATQQLLVINVQAVSGQNSAYHQTLIVQTLTKTTLVLMYTDGDVEGFYSRKQ